MTWIQRIPGNFTIKNDWPRIGLWAPNKVWTSDDFTNAGRLGGAQTDAILGGVPMTWVSSNGQPYEAINGVAHSTTTNGGIFISGLGESMEVSVKIAALPAEGQNTSIILKRDQVQYHPELSQLEVRLFYTGNVNARQEKRTAGVVETWNRGVTSETFMVGDELGVRIRGSSIELLRNGNVVSTGNLNLSILPGRWAGLYSTGAEQTAGFDWFKFTAL